MKDRRRTASVLAGAGLATIGLIAAPAAAETTVTITIENLAPVDGNWLTPVWTGFHQGGFDLFDVGSTASPSLEQLAETGGVSVLQDLFSGEVPGGNTAVVGGKGPIAPGAVVVQELNVSEVNRYLSYASMVIPSNDAFIGNDDPQAIEIFDEAGNFLGADFFVTGADVLDAGTEVNDEVPENTAFFGQTDPFAGVDEGGTVGVHPGYLGSLGNPGTPSILADPDFSGADFTIPGYPIARITVVPAPGAVALLGLAGLVGGRRSRRRD